MAKLNHVGPGRSVVWEILPLASRAAVANADIAVRVGAALLLFFGFLALIRDWVDRSVYHYDRPLPLLVFSIFGLLGFALLVWFVLLPRVRSLLAVALLRRHLATLAQVTAIPALGDLPDGKPVLVRGRVRGRPTISAVTTADTGVFRHLSFVVVPPEGVSRLEEEADDFALCDDAGATVPIDVAEAHLVVPPDAGRRLSPQAALDLARHAGAPIYPDLPPVAHGHELLLHDGDRIEVFAYKVASVDPTVQRLGRETPLAAQLRGGDPLPMLIFVR